MTGLSSRLCHQRRIYYLALVYRVLNLVMTDDDYPSEGSVNVDLTTQ
ncbi:hypothetical protein [Spirosoma humi]